MRVFIALGSNLGNSIQNLELAVKAIGQTYPVVSRSSVIRTKAQYIEGQPDFYNQVIEVAGRGTAPDLLEFLHRIEMNMGRVRAVKYGPRLIDLDIIFFGDLVLDTSTLSIPHPLFAERDFVIKPLSEIAPDWICPRIKQSIEFLAHKLVNL